MKLYSMVLLLSLSLPCQAQQFQYPTPASKTISQAVARQTELPMPQTTGINKTCTCTALIHLDREPRKWKTLKLIPGKVALYQYEWVLEDGTTVTKVETVKQGSHLPSRVPLRESHPNLAIAGSVALLALNGVVAGRRR